MCGCLSCAWHQRMWLTTQTCALTGNHTSDPLLHSPVPNPLSHTSQGKLNANCDADSLLSLLSHFECDGHTVHMLTEGHLPPPLTSTVQSSLFTHVHSSPLTLAARLYHYIDNGLAFSRQTLYMCVCVFNFFSL